MFLSRTRVYRLCVRRVYRHEHVPDLVFRLFGTDSANYSAGVGLHGSCIRHCNGSQMWVNHNARRRHPGGYQPRIGDAVRQNKNNVDCSLVVLAVISCYFFFGAWNWSIIGTGTLFGMF